ncbi:hypothetical protein [Thiolapillus sp.]|uniref:hypothetical protein n=1 Tax=Thiolapillus sp. TaxID=2017437 RepID=UPI0025DD608F|nr:hypothetical protein [Thiolapillus sp.]
MESNDSPEIPDRGETSDIPGLPSGGERERERERERFITIDNNPSANKGGRRWGNYIQSTKLHRYKLYPKNMCHENHNTHFCVEIFQFAHSLRMALNCQFII